MRQANRLEFVGRLELVERAVPGKDIFQQLAQRRDVPLPVAQVIDQPVLSLRGSDVEGPVKGIIGNLHPQSFIQDEQRRHRLDHRLGEVVRLLGLLFGPFERVNVNQHQHRAVDRVVQRQIGAGSQQEPAARLVLHLALSRAGAVNDPGQQLFGRQTQDCA